LRGRLGMRSKEESRLNHQVFGFPSHFLANLSCRVSIHLGFSLWKERRILLCEQGFRLSHGVI
jgi:hypothetical protein